MFNIPEFSRTEIETILQSLGMDINPRDATSERLGVKPCPGPNHHGGDERFGNLHLYLGGKPRFRCFACNWHGDLLDAVQLIQRCDFRAALKFLGGEFNTIPYFRDDRKKDMGPKVRPQEVVKKPRLKLEEFDPQEFDYTRRRGYTREYCDFMSIRYCSKHIVYGGYMITSLPEGKVFEARKIRELEAMVELGFPTQQHDLKYLRDVYSIWRDQNPDMENAATMYLDLPRVRYPKYSMKDKKFVFNQRHLDTSKEVWICEGTAGVPKIWLNFTRNVCATFGTEISTAQQQILMRFPRRVFVPDKGRPALAMMDKNSREMPGCFVICVDSEDHEDSHVENLGKAEICSAQEYVLRKLDGG